MIAKKPFYVSFIHDKIPGQIDHSQSNPGPANNMASRAGYTSLKLKPRLTIKLDNGNFGSDGKYPLYYVSVNIFFLLSDFVVAVSSNYALGSCAYNTTLKHELDAHIFEPIRIFHSHRDVLVRRLNAIAIPTESSPVRISSDAESQALISRIDSQIVRVVGLTRNELLLDLRQARNLHDSPQSYRLVYNQCTDVQWTTGR